MKRVVADSNIHVSALQFGGKPLALLNLAQAGQIDLAISEPILAETLGILRKKFYRSDEELSERATRTCWIWAASRESGFRGWPSSSRVSQRGTACPEQNRRKCFGAA